MILYLAGQPPGGREWKPRRAPPPELYEHVLSSYFLDHGRRKPRAIFRWVVKRKRRGA